MSEIDTVTKRSVPFPGGMCNVRLGHGALSVLGGSLAACTGRPRRALLACEAGADGEVRELVRRQLTDAGYEVRPFEVAAGEGARSLGACEDLFRALAEAGVTSDDAVVAVGGADALSACVFCAGLWCGGVTCAFVPTDLAAAVEPVARPRVVYLPGSSADLLRGSAYPRLLVADLDRLPVDGSPASLLARAYMASAAMAAGERQLGELASAADAIAALDVEATSSAVLECLRSRGRLSNSNAVAVRPSLRYGLPVAEALEGLVPDAGRGRLLAEGLRFSARLAAGVVDEPDVDLIFAQDALLDRLGLPELACEVDPGRLAGRIREVCLRESNRVMLPLPSAIGKVRLASVPDDVLAEHAEAWCAARARNVARAAAPNG